MKYTTFEICQIILRNMAIQSAQAIEYPLWSDSFVRSEINGFVDKIKNADWFTPIDPSLMTKHQMDQLMFNQWSDESDMMLIPLYLRQFIQEGVVVKSIDNKLIDFYLDSIDNDHRYGCLAYGVSPAKEEEHV